MHKNRIIASILFIIVIVLPGIVSAAKFISISKQVYVKPAGKTSYYRASLKMGLKTGDQIVCRNGTAVVSAGRGRFTIRPNSKITITDAIEGKKQGQGIIANVGRVTARVSKGNDAVSFGSPTAVAGVRGTEFDIVVADDGTTQWAVTEGAIAVENDKGAVEVGTGKSSIVGMNAGPQAPADFDTAANDFTSWIQSVNKKIKGNEPSICASMKARIEANNITIEALKKEYLTVSNNATLQQKESSLLTADGTENAVIAAQKKAKSAMGLYLQASVIYTKMRMIDILNYSIVQSAERIQRNADESTALQSNVDAVAQAYQEQHVWFAARGADNTALDFKKGRKAGKRKTKKLNF